MNRPQSETVPLQKATAFNTSPAKVTLADTEELVKVLKSINKSMRLREYMIHGFVYGIFQVLGATIGISIIFFLLGQILYRVDKIPVIQDFIQSTQIVKIIQDEVDKRNGK